MQVYAQSLQLAYERCTAKGPSQGDDTSPDDSSDLQEFQELCQRVAAAHAGFVSNAGDALGVIVHDGIDYVFEVCAVFGGPFKGRFCVRGDAVHMWT